METVRDKAAYLPDNLEYIRRSNGLQTRREVFDLILAMDYVIVAVGFLCGAPILFPLSPKTLTCQKYNPTRISTPGGTIGLGGTILSGYSCEQPGGYMMVARTLEMWDTFSTKPGFSQNQPWLLQPFDKVSFFEVSIEEYDHLAVEFAAGRYQWRISESKFNVREAYERFQNAKRDSEVIEYKRRQREGLVEQTEVEKNLYASWKAEAAAAETADDSDVAAINGNELRIPSPLTANVWKVNVKVGDILQEGHLVAVLEAMKMEVNVFAPAGSGGLRVHSIMKKPNSIAGVGDTLLIAV